MLNLKFIIIGIVIAVIAISIIALLLTTRNSESNFNDRTKALEMLSDITPINISQQGTGDVLLATGDSIFETFVYSGDRRYTNEGLPTIEFQQRHFLLKPENTDLYREIGVAFEQHNSVFVVPIFTMAAYGEPGFYNYFRGECGTECLNDIPIRYELRPTFESSANTIKVLRLLGYPYITDIEIDKNPSILNLFDKVILLHSEYVTKSEFEAITKHPKVIYLHPNALYAEIEVDYEKDTITLVRGHNYPSPEIQNGFDWKFDNTHPFEYDTQCEDWEFIQIDNGIMLNCYPENIIFQDKLLLKTIKEY